MSEACLHNKLGARAVQVRLLSVCIATYLLYDRRPVPSWTWGRRSRCSISPAACSKKIFLFLLNFFSYSFLPSSFPLLSRSPEPLHSQSRKHQERCRAACEKYTYTPVYTLEDRRLATACSYSPSNDTSSRRGNFGR